MDAPAGVVFVGGYARTGSTLLDRLLGQIDGFASFGELRHVWERNFRGNQLCGCGRPFRSCPFWNDVVEVAFGGWGGVDPLPWGGTSGGSTACGTSPACSRGVDGGVPRGVPCLPGRGRGAVPGDGGGVGGPGPRGLDEGPSAPVRAPFGRARRARSGPGPGQPGGGVLVAEGQAAAGDHLAASGHAAVLRGPERDGLRTSPTSPPRPAGWWGRARSSVRGPDARPPRQLARLAGELGLGDVDLSFLDGHSATLHPAHTVAGNPVRFARGDHRAQGGRRWTTAMPGGQRTVVTALTSPLLAGCGCGR